MWMGMLSKMFGSCGGFVGGFWELIDYLWYMVFGFVFVNGILLVSMGVVFVVVWIFCVELDCVWKFLVNLRFFLFFV